MDEWERAGYPEGLYLEADWEETEYLTALTGSEELASVLAPTFSRQAEGGP